MTLIPAPTPVHPDDDRLAGGEPLLEQTPPPAERTPPVAEQVPPVVPVESKAFSVASLVLGIASLAFGYTVIVPIVGLVLGILALNREPANRAMSIWGIVLSGLTIAGGLLAVLLGVSLLVPLGIASAFAG